MNLKNPYIIWIFLLGICILPTQPVLGQTVLFRVHTGSMYYQGDLAPRPLSLSFGPSNLAYGTSVGTEFFSWLGVSTKILRGQISGDDAYASDYARKERNLSFTSSVTEVSLFTDIRINYFWKRLDKYKLRLYLTGGVGYMTFDPKTYYQNELVRLQPLGTEGQFLPNSKLKPYALHTITRPLGGIIEFDVAPKTSFGFEVTAHKSYTDYLDDVSGSYVNYDEMVAAGQTQGALLSNRTGEYLGTSVVKVPTGTVRGNSTKKDWFTYFGFHVKYSFGAAIPAIPIVTAALADSEEAQAQDNIQAAIVDRCSDSLVILPSLPLSDQSGLIMRLYGNESKVQIGKDTLCFNELCDRMHETVTSEKPIYIIGTQDVKYKQVLKLKSHLNKCVDQLKAEKALSVYKKPWDEINSIQQEAVIRLLNIKIIETIDQ